MAIAFFVVGALCILWLVYNKVHILQEEYKRDARARAQDIDRFMDQFQEMQKRGRK